jgi:hypothetical protein
MTGSGALDVLEAPVRDIPVRDAWEALPAEVRDEFVAARLASTDWDAFGRQSTSSGRWEPLRPVILTDTAYRHLESIVARLLELAVDSCRRRAATLGELRDALRIRWDMPLMDPDAPLVTSELTRCARPDLLIEQGRPRVLEFNIGTRLGGGTLTPRMAQGFSRLCPRAGLYPPPSTIAARTEAMVRALGGAVGPDRPRRLAIPAYTTVECDGSHKNHRNAQKSVQVDAERAGFEIVRPEIGELRVDADDRLLAGGAPVDLVLVRWATGEMQRMVDAAEGLEAMRRADRAGTVTLFPRCESVLTSSKAVLGWLHEDCEAGLLAPGDAALVRAHVPRTVVLGLGRSTGALPEWAKDRAQVVAKPAVGRSGAGVLFGSRASDGDWLAAAADEAPMVLQQRVVPDRIAMPFLDRSSGRQVTADVPYVVSPYMVDGAASDVAVRHMAPSAPAEDVVISVSQGGRSNTAVLMPDHA